MLFILRFPAKNLLFRDGEDLLHRGVKFLGLFRRCAHGSDVIIFGFVLCSCDDGALGTSSGEVVFGVRVKGSAMDGVCDGVGVAGSGVRAGVDGTCFAGDSIAPDGAVRFSATIEIIKSAMPISIPTITSQNVGVIVQCTSSSSKS